MFLSGQINISSGVIWGTPPSWDAWPHYGSKLERAEEIYGELQLGEMSTHTMLNRRREIQKILSDVRNNEDNPVIVEQVETAAAGVELILSSKNLGEPSMFWSGAIASGMIGPFNLASGAI